MVSCALLHPSLHTLMPYRKTVKHAGITPDSKLIAPVIRRPAQETDPLYPLSDEKSTANYSSSDIAVILLERLDASLSLSDGSDPFCSGNGRGERGDVGYLEPDGCFADVGIIVL